MQPDHIAAYSKQMTESLATAKRNKILVVGGGAVLTAAVAALMYMQKDAGAGKNTNMTTVNGQEASKPEAATKDDVNALSFLFIKDSEERKKFGWQRPMINGIQTGALLGIAGFVGKTLNAGQSAVLKRLQAFGFFDPAHELRMCLHASLQQAFFVQEALQLFQSYAKPPSGDQLYLQLHHNMIQNIIHSQQIFVQSLERTIGFFAAMVAYHYDDEVDQVHVHASAAMMDKLVLLANHVCGQLAMLCQDASNVNVDECVANFSALESIIKQYLSKTYYDLFGAGV